MGKSNKQEVPAAKTPQQIAAEQVAAQVESIPRAAELNWQVKTNPTYGELAQTQYEKMVRESAFPQETGIQNQLMQNTLAQLQNPNYVTPEEQAAIDQGRNLARQQVTESLRNRANLSGNLYGGRAGAAEQQTRGYQEATFAEQDINRRQANMTNTSNLALSILQALYPDVNLTQPAYINPVPSAETTYNAYTTARGQDAAIAAQQQLAQAQMRSALYQALGSAAGAGISGGIGLFNKGNSISRG